MRETKSTTVSLLHDSRVRPLHSYTLDPGPYRTGPFAQKRSGCLRHLLSGNGKDDPQLILYQKPRRMHLPISTDIWNCVLRSLRFQISGRRNIRTEPVVACQLFSRVTHKGPN